MIDYAKVKVLERYKDKEKEKVKVKAKAKAIIINPSYLFFTVLLTLLIYFLAYQNMNLAQMKHNINTRRVVLHSLILEQQNLLKDRSQTINPKNILSNETFYTSLNRVKVEH